MLSVLPNKPMSASGFAVVTLLLLVMPAHGSDFVAERAAMVEHIRALVALTREELGRHALRPRVLAALGKVERHRFVPPRVRALAYADRPLPIGQGQTISQPYIVAIMTELIDPEPEDVVLEIGTGSGYQAAVLAALVKRVYSVEIIAALEERARGALSVQSYNNVTTRLADGYHGWAEHAPFDAIVVTAAAASIPPPLVRQLKPGGRMIIPVGSPFRTQQLVLVSKADDGTVTTRQLMPVRFVPLTRAK